MGDIGIFVDTFLKEIPENKVAKNIDKNNFTSKISQLPSLSSITSNEMRDLLLSVELPSGSEVSKHRYLELDDAKLEDTSKESMEQLKNQPTKNTKAPAKIQFAEVFLKSLPELADSSSLTDAELLNNLSDMYEHVPKDGKEIKERLGLTKSAVQSYNNLNEISDFELENLVRETINDIRQKPQHTRLQKPAEAQFADLFLKKVPTLHSSSDKTEKDLRESLLDLHRKVPSNAAEIRMLLGLQAHPSSLKEPESTKTGPEAHKEKDLNKGKQKKNLTASDVVEGTDVGFLDIKLKPVKVAGEDLSGLTTVTVETSPDTKDDDSLLRTIENFDDLTNMLEKMRRKPTVLEVFSKEKGSLKEIDKSIDRALSKAKLAVSKKLD